MVRIIIVPGSDSAFMRAARSSSVEAPPIAGSIALAVQQIPSTVEGPRMTDNTVQQCIAGLTIANDMRVQYRQQVRNARAGGNTDPVNTVPIAFQHECFEPRTTYGIASTSTSSQS